MLKCSRCQHVFAGPWTTSLKTRRSKPTPLAEGETASFDFGEPDQWEHDLDAAEPEEEFSLDDEDVETPPPVVKMPPPPPEPAPVLTWDDPEEDVMGEGLQRISLRPVLILLVIVVTVYAVLAWALSGNPEWAQELVGQIPFVGDGVSSQLLNDQVDLIKVEGGYQRTREGKTFFLITGQALNNSAVPLAQVQVVARLLDKKGTVLQEKPTFAGSNVPLTVLRDLSLHAMEIIPHLKATDRSVIQPGEALPFVIVFTDVGGQVAEVTTEVLAAQRQA